MMWTLLFVAAFAGDPPTPPTGLGHCADTESVWFHCSVKGGKVASVCGSAEATVLHYRFGKPGQVELSVGGAPQEKGIRFATATGMRDESWTLSFPNEGHTYELGLFHMFGYQPDGEPDPGTATVTVKKGEEELVRLVCTSPDVKGPFQRLEELLRTP